MSATTKIKKRVSFVEVEELADDAAFADAEDGDDEQMGSDPSENGDEEENVTLGEGWANVMKSLINSNPKKKNKKKSLILSRAKKDRDIVMKKSTEQPVDQPIEMVDDQGQVKKMEEVENGADGIKEPRVKRVKNNWETLARVKVNPEDKEKERRLRSIATKGVVQLFNAVRQQQETIQEKLGEAGPSERKQDRVLAGFTKNKFLDKLKTGEKAAKDKDEESDQQSSDEKKKEGWKVLRDDFIQSAKMKDWDKESESEDAENCD